MVKPTKFVALELRSGTKEPPVIAAVGINETNGDLTIQHSLPRNCHIVSRGVCR